MLAGTESALADRSLLVRCWDDINPTIAMMLGFQDMGTGVILLMFFSVAALGILNTMLMSVFERTKELGVIRALGLRPRQLVALVMWETMALVVVAVALGLPAGLGMDAYLVYHGLDLSSVMEGYSILGINYDPVWKGEFHLDRVIQTVFGLVVISCLASVWPAIRAARLRPVEAMRQE